MWYDISNKALFDASFRTVVAEVDDILIGILGREFIEAGHANPENVDLSYALFTGAFHHLMRGRVNEDARDRETMMAIFRTLVDQFL